MNEAGYQRAKANLANMEVRLEALRARTDLEPWHKDAAIHSYLDMMRQYRREIKLYEAGHRAGGQPAPPSVPTTAP